MAEPAREESALRLASDLCRRRKWIGFLTFVGAFTAAVSVAAFLPDVYQSAATVLVEHEQVPETFVRPAVTSQLETRLQTVNEEILSRARLRDLIARFDLYPELRKRLPSEAIVARMRRDIGLDVKAEPAGGRRITISFALIYRGRNPQTVADVANALAGLYVQENARMRERQAAETTEFLKAKLAESKRRLDEHEQRINAFKVRYMGELPEQTDVNLATLERLNAQLRLNNENQIRALERRERLAKQLAELEASSAAGSPEDVTARLATLRRELAELRARFTDRYPDVVRAKAEIAALERRLVRSDPNSTAEVESAPFNPTVERLKEVLREMGAETRALKEQAPSLRQAIAITERRVENAPKRQQELQELSRDYGASKDLYFSLLKRYEEAELAASMEQGGRGERFRVLDPAVPPREPVAPNPLRLALFGFAFSFALAAGAMALAERLDTSFHTVDELRAFSRVPVLVSIPHIVTAADAGAWPWRFSLAAAWVVLGLALIVGAAYYLAHGNEQLVWMLARGRF